MCITKKEHFPLTNQVVGNLLHMVWVKNKNGYHILIIKNQIIRSKYEWNTYLYIWDRIREICLMFKKIHSYEHFATHVNKPEN